MATFAPNNWAVMFNSLRWASRLKGPETMSCTGKVNWIRLFFINGVLNVGALINAQTPWMFLGSVTTGIAGVMAVRAVARSSKALLSRSVYAVGIYATCGR